MQPPPLNSPAPRKKILQKNQGAVDGNPENSGEKAGLPGFDSFKILSRGG